MVTTEYQFPRITPEMYARLSEWYMLHNKGSCAKAYKGAVGGDLTFEITPTSIGDFVSVKCSCGGEHLLAEP